MAAFLDLDAKAVEQLKLEVEHFAGGAIIKTSEGELARITHGLSPSELISPGELVACLCLTGRNAAADTQLVQTKPDDNRLGFIFPTTAFSEPEQIEGSWAARFAEAGFRLMLQIDRINQFSQIRSADNLKSRGSMPVDEFFGDDLSILVLSRKDIKALRVSLDELELMLLRAGVAVLQNRTLPRPHLRASPQHQNANLRRLCLEARSEATGLRKLYYSADRSESDIGSFLAYYQVIEFLLERIFRNEISHLTSTGLTTWALREQLNGMANEKFRLHLLSSKYLTQGCDRTLFTTVHEKASLLLTELGDVPTEDGTWFGPLYRVRGIIVHSQLRLFYLRSPALLSDLCTALRFACLELLCHFTV